MSTRSAVNRARVVQPAAARDARVSATTHARALALAWLAAAACSAPPPAITRFPLELHAGSADGSAVAGVRAWADGEELGTTAAGGTLHAELRGRDGQAVTLTTACPPAFRTLDSRRRLVLRASTRAGTRTSAPLALHIACEPTERSAILIVRARSEGPLIGMPIRKDGAVVGQTDLEGTAHLLFKVRPGSSLRIALDTSAWPALVPRDPVQSYELADEDSILLVDPEFTRLPAAPLRTPRKAPSPRPPSTSRVPYRIR